MESRTVIIGDRFLIVDETLSGEKRRRIQELKWVDNQPIQFLEDVDMSYKMDVLLENELKDAVNTLLVFPGNGSLYPRRQLETVRRFPSCKVYAERVWVPGTKPIIKAGLILPDIFLVPFVQKIIVIDDVISSGGTMRMLHQVNAWKFPRAQWVASAWVTQKLRSRPTSGLHGFVRTLCPYEVRKKNGSKAAINSLSTLRAKYEIAQSYALRHLSVESHEEFFQCLL